MLETDDVRRTFFERDEFDAIEKNLADPVARWPGSDG
jgi:hypothetical protein